MVAYLDRGNMSPETDFALDRWRERQGNVGGYVDLKTARARLEGMEAWGPDDFAEAARTRVYAKFPKFDTFPPEHQRYLAEAELRLRKEDWEVDIGNLRHAVERASALEVESLDRLPSPEARKAILEGKPWMDEVVDPKTGEKSMVERFGPPPKYDPQGLVGLTIRALSGPSRGSGGTLAGLADYSMQHGAAADPEYKEPPIRPTMPPEGPEGAAGGAMLGYMAKGAPVHPTADLTSVAGVNLTKVPGAIASGELNVLEALKEGFGRGADAAFHEDPQSVHDLVAHLYKVQHQFRGKAEQIVNEQLQASGYSLDDASEEQKKKLVGQVATNLIQQDLGAESPELAQLANDFILDPTYLLGPAKIVKGAWKLGVKVAPQAAEAMAKVGRNISRMGVEATKYVRATPNIDMLKASGQAVGKTGDHVTAPASDVADMVRREWYGAESVKDELGKVIPDIEAMKASDAKVAEEAWTAHKAGAEVSELSPEVGKIVEAARAAEPKISRVTEKTGIGRDIRDGTVVLPRREPKTYAPERVGERIFNPVEDIADASREGASYRTRLQAKSAKPRKSAIKPTKDLHIQHVANLQEISNKAVAGAQVRRIHKALKQGKSIIELPLPKMNVGKQERFIEQAAKQLKMSEDAVKEAIGDVTDLQSKGAWEKADELIKGMKGSMRQQKKVRHALARAKVEWLQAKRVQDKIKSTIDDLGKSSGYEWGALSTANVGGPNGAPLAEVWFRLTGTPLSKEIGNRVHIMPKAVIDQIATLIPVLYDQPGQVSTAMKAWQAVSKHTLKPLNAISRSLMTMLSPGRYARDIIATPGIASLSNGIKAANPKYYARAGYQVADVIAGGKGGRVSKVMLPNGKTVNQAWIAEQAKDSGLLGQGDLLLGFTQSKEKWNPIAWTQRRIKTIMGDMTPQQMKELEKLSPTTINPLIGVQNAVEWGLDKTKLKQLNGAIDDYQKLVTFNMFLKGDKPVDVARAAELTRKWTHDYRSLSHAEKEFVNPTAMFYTFYRFAYTAGVKTLFAHPERLSWGPKLYKYQEQQWGKYFPNKHGSYPKQFEGLLVTAPMSRQPPAARKAYEEGRFDDLAAMDHTMDMIETPFGYAAAPLQMIGALRGGTHATKARDTAGRHASIWATTMLSAAFGVDVFTGKKLDAFPELITDKSWIQWKAHAEKTAFGKAMSKTMKSPTMLWKMLKTLRDHSNDPDEWMSFALRLSMHNYAQGAEKLLADMAGGKFADLDGAPIGSASFLTTPGRTDRARRKTGENLVGRALYEMQQRRE